MLQTERGFGKFGSFIRSGATYRESVWPLTIEYSASNEAYTVDAADSHGYGQRRASGLLVLATLRIVLGLNALQTLIASGLFEQPTNALALYLGIFA